MILFDLFEKTTEMLNEQIDRLMELLRPTDPEFYNKILRHESGESARHPPPEQRRTGGDPAWVPPNPAGAVVTRGGCVPQSPER